MAWVYILLCADGTYYVGSTINLERRLWEHNHSDEGATYTKRRGRRPVTLVWSADFSSIKDAFAFEKRVQGWSRKKREALMRGDYDALIALARRKAMQVREGGGGDGG